MDSESQCWNFFDRRHWNTQLSKSSAQNRFTTNHHHLLDSPLNFNSIDETVAHRISNLRSESSHSRLVNFFRGVSMASKFGLAGGLPERRVRPIWDAIDSRQFKNALKAVTTLLAKYPNAPYALVTKYNRSLSAVDSESE